MADKPAQEDPQHSTADYDQYSKPEKPIRNWTRIFSTFIIVLVVLGAVGGAFWYLKNHKSAKPVPVQTAQTAPAKITATTKSYSSPNLYLSFDYPANWTIVDTGNNIMTATSPTMQLKNAAGQAVDGKIVMTIQSSAPTLPGFTAGNATAVIASQKVTYTKPTQTQRVDTYLSFLAYATTTSKTGLDAVYVSGNNGYTLGQAIPEVDLAKVSPIISLTFVDSSGKALTIAASNWDNAAFSGPLQTMLQSLSIT